MPSIYLIKLAFKSGIMLGYLNWALKLGKVYTILGYAQGRSYGGMDKDWKGVKDHVIIM